MSGQQQKNFIIRLQQGKDDFMILLGKTRLNSVTVAENASDLTRCAAAELQKYLALVTGRNSNAGKRFF